MVIQFPLLNCMIGCHHRPLQGFKTPKEGAEKAVMRSMRVNIEWPYETATNLFKILESKCNKELLAHNCNSSMWFH